MWIIIGPTNFRPDDKMTREQYIKFLLSVQGITISKTNIQTFSDIGITKWSHPYIETAVKNQIIKPEEYEGKKFSPDKPITRAEMVVFLIRSLGAEKSVFHPNFISEAEKNEYFSDIKGIPEEYYIKYAARTGLINGFEDGTFRPYQTATRAEIVSLLY